MAMPEKITRREALKMGTTAAVTGVIAPHVSSATHPDSLTPDDSLMPNPADSTATAMTESEICFMSARQMTELIRQKKLSAREVMQAHLKQIARVNPKVNAIVTLVPEEELMVQALAADEAAANAISKGRCTGFL